MIWLNKKDNDRDFITCNMITCSDDKLKCLEEIKKELMDSKKYILSHADVIHNCWEYPFRLNKGIEMIESQNVANIDGENIYVRRYYNNPKVSSLEILSQVNLSREEQLSMNIDLLKMLNNDLMQIDIMSKILVMFGGKIDYIRFVFENLWQDFYFFAKEVLDVIEIEELERYDLLDLEEIQKLSIKNKIQDSCKEILLYKDVASSNEKVLSLAKNINSLEGYYKNR